MNQLNVFYILNLPKCEAKKRKAVNTLGYLNGVRTPSPPQQQAVGHTCGNGMKRFNDSITYHI